MWDSDWSWQARSSTVSALLPPLPLHTNQEIVEVCFFIPLVATPFAGVDACFFRRFSLGFFLFISLVWLFFSLSRASASEVSQTCRRGEDLHSGRTMRWVKRRKSLHLHCVSRLHFVFRPLVWQRATVKSWPCNVSVEAARSFNRHSSCFQHAKSRFSPRNKSSCWLFFFCFFFCVVSPHTGTHDSVEQGFYFVTLAGE